MIKNLMHHHQTCHVVILNGPRVSGTGLSSVQIVTCFLYMQDEEAKTPSKKKKKKQEENGSEVSEFFFLAYFSLVSD